MQLHNSIRLQMAKDFIVKVLDNNNCKVSNDYELVRCCNYPLHLIITLNAGANIGQEKILITSYRKELQQSFLF